MLNEISQTQKDRYPMFSPHVKKRVLKVSKGLLVKQKETGKRGKGKARKTR
jgi:hypothetical protein